MLLLVSASDAAVLPVVSDGRSHVWSMHLLRLLFPPLWVSNREKKFQPNMFETNFSGPVYLSRLEILSKTANMDRYFCRTGCMCMCVPPEFH
jgi:hypothetical protein